MSLLFSFPRPPLPGLPSRPPDDLIPVSAARSDTWPTASPPTAGRRFVDVKSQVAPCPICSNQIPPPPVPYLCVISRCKVLLFYHTTFSITRERRKERRERGSWNTSRYLIGHSLASERDEGPGLAWPASAPSLFILPVDNRKHCISEGQKQ